MIIENRFQEILDSLERTYALDLIRACGGDPPAAFKTIDTETGDITHYFDKRPE